MTIAYHRVTTEDAAVLSALFTEFVGKESDIEAMKQQIERLSAKPEYYVAGAYRNEKLVGTAMGIVCIDLVGNCKPFLLIENVVVSPDAQGKGVGKGLMQELQRFAEEHQCNYMILASSNERADAHRFYESIGFAGAKRGFMKTLNAG
ncbi:MULTISPECIES: GNAT family N-acetyltransferase [Paenibacillus]|uniref:GNAT superfamily N-acetyltransferase n=1 Tax=Paenibacillus lactis TaxID=228574 RepID=A0ABS4FAT4_9BACL|nr:GNAT family N-acetyltransferase [Paenibacillus lactis]MBP1893328.1 GNAT superfamily N-acetyltransferase [Paenibacillus lactis]GIO90953.1 N-acetyltransferase [Paenibacillus lactis]HAG01416.1 GNAT family N-acetyltransferase [Paenibacillus lactis]